MRMYALYTNAGAPVTGLTLSDIKFTVKRIKKSDNSLSTPVNAQVAQVEAGGGYYLYDYTTDFVTYDYVWYAQYTGVSSVDSAYVFGQTDEIAQADSVPGVAQETTVTTGIGDIKGTGFAKDTDSLVNLAHTSALTDMAKDSTVAKEATLSAIGVLVLRILGLTQENQYIDNTIFDADNHMLTARIRTYTDAASVGTGVNVLATYNVTATYDVDGNMSSFKVVKA